MNGDREMFDIVGAGILLAVVAVPYSYLLARTMSTAYFKSKLSYNDQLSKYFMEERVSKNEKNQ